MLSLEEAKYLGKLACVLKLGKGFCKRHQENFIVTYDNSHSEENVFCYCGFAQELESQYIGMLEEEETVPYFVSCFIDRNLEIITFTEWCVPPMEDEEKRIPPSADVLYIKHAEEGSYFYEKNKETT